MNRINLAFLLAALCLSAPARAAFAPVRLPSLSILPATVAAPITISFPSMPLSPLLPAPSLPSPSLPVNFPRTLPGAWNHLPVELPAEAAVPVPNPAHDTYHMDWSFLDGGEVAHVASPVGQASQSLPKPGARAQLAYAAEIFSHDVAAAADLVYNGAVAASVR